MSKLKPYIRRCLCSMILAAFSSCAVAQVVSVEAKGRDEKVARTNACVAAARQMMLQMTEDSFVKSHGKQIRSEIISKADSFVTSVKITEQKQNGKTLVIRADVDVDRTVLAGALSAMGATIVKSYADVLEERRKNETEGLKTIFGHDVALQTAAVPLKPVNGIRPVTDETVPGAELSNDGRKVYEPGELFSVFYTVPRYHEATRRNNRTYYTVVSSDVPVDYEESRSNSITNNEIRMDRWDGVFRIMAPSRNGAYEIRMYSSSKDSNELLARMGFSVKATRLPEISLVRDTFMPGELVSVTVNDLDSWENGFLALVPASGSDKAYRSAGVIKSSNSLRELDLPVVNFDAPAEPGEYSILFYDRCSDCNGSENNDKTQPALVKVNFKVEKPAPQISTTFLQLPAEITSGGRMGYIVGCGEDWAENAFDVRVYRKGLEKEIYSDWGKCGDGHFVTKNTRELYETGDYEMVLLQGKDEAQKKISREFRVVAPAADSRRTASIEIASNEAEQNSSFMISGSTLVNWPDDSFIALVPKKHPRDVKSVLEYIGDKKLNVGHRRNFRMGFSVTENSGDYELRLYNTAREDGSIQAAAALHIMTDDEMKRHSEQIRKNIENYFNEPDRDELKFQENLIRNFHIPKPPKQGGLTARPVVKIYEGEREPELEMTRVAMSATDCDKYIDEEIRDMSRIDITLGREGNFEGELKNFGKTLLLKFPFADDSKMKKLQEVVDEVSDVYGNTVAGLDQLSEADYTGALKTGLLMMLKGAMNHCSDEQCLQKLITANSSSLKDRMARMSDKAFENTYKTLDQALGKGAKGKQFLKELSDYRKAIAADAKKMSDNKDNLSNTLDVIEDVSTLTGTIAGGNYTDKEAYANAALSIIALKFPISVASVKLSYQAYLSSRDFARDVSVIRMYGKWKKVGGDSRGSLGYEDFARIWKEDWKLHKDSVMQQAKKAMIATMGNELTKRAFTKANRNRARKYMDILQKDGYEAAQEYIINSDLISEDEVYDFLEAQFTEWEKAENMNSEFARDAKSVKEQFKRMRNSSGSDCRTNFYAWYQGQVDERNKKLGWGTRMDNYLWGNVSSLWNKGCPREVDAFMAYYKTIKEIERELKSWNRGGGKCSNKYVRDDAEQMLCKLVVDEEDYLKDVANRACECGWKALYYDNEIKIGSELEQYRREAEVINVMTAIGNDSVLHCLCEYGRVSHGGASSSVGISFSPGATGMAPGGVCGKNQRGGCFASGWSCWHYTMPTDSRGLEQCKYREALKNAKDREAVESAVEEARRCNANYDYILLKAKEAKEEKRRRENEINSRI